MKQNLVEFVSLTDVAHLSSKQLWNKVHVCLAESPAISRGDSRTCRLLPLLCAGQLTERWMYVLPPRCLRQKVSTKAVVRPDDSLACSVERYQRLREMSWKRNRALLDCTRSGRTASTTRGRSSFTGTWMCTESSALVCRTGGGRANHFSHDRC